VGRGALPSAAVAVRMIGNQRSVFKKRKVSLAFFGSFLGNAKMNIEKYILCYSFQY